MSTVRPCHPWKTGALPWVAREKNGETVANRGENVEKPWRNSAARPARPARVEQLPVQTVESV